MTTPGLKTASLSIFFGKISDKKWEVKKIDKIKITWKYFPKVYRIFTWYPGSSWTLLKKVENLQEPVHEFNFEGLKSTALLIEMDEGYKHKEFQDEVAYGITEVYIGAKGYKMINKPCNQLANNQKVWDLDSQTNLSISKTKDFGDEIKKFSSDHDKLIAIFNNLKKDKKTIKKTNKTAEEIQKNISSYEKNFDNKNKELEMFKIEDLKKYKNLQFLEYLALLENKGVDKFNRSTAYSLGTNEKNPAISCIQLKKMNSNVISGFYWIKPVCSKYPLKVWCDFNIFKTAVDYYILSDSPVPNKDLNKWNITNERDIGYRCSKLGLRPLQLMNRDIVHRLVTIVKALGYELNQPQVIPLGFDYNCQTTIGCIKQFNSLNKRNTQNINFFFQKDFTDTAKDTGSMAGIGFGNIDILKVFDPRKTKMTALVCSTNEFEVSKTKSPIFVDCDMTLNGNGDTFKVGKQKLIQCDSSCNQSQKSVYGNGPYDGRSSICKAAIHAGKLDSKGGIIKVKVIGKNNVASQEGSANGILTKQIFESDLKEGYMSFDFITENPICPIEEYAEQAKLDNNDDLSFTEFTTSVKNSKGFNIPIDELAQLEDDDLKELINEGYNINMNEINESRKKNEMLNFRFSENPFKKGLKMVDGTAKKNGGKVGGGNFEKLAQQVSDMTPEKAVKASSQALDNAMDSSKKALKSMTSSLYDAVTNNSEDSKPENNYDKSKSEESKKEFDPTQMPKDPEVEEVKIKKPDPNLDCTPSTNSATKRVEQIFKENFSSNIENYKVEIKKIEEEIKSYKDLISFESNGTEISTKILFRRVQLLTEKMNILNGKLKISLNRANARKNLTNEIKEKWLDKMIAMIKFNKFLLQFDKKIEDMFVIRKSKTMNSDVPDWKIETSSIKGRNTAVGINGKIIPRQGIIGSALILKDKEGFDFILDADILVTNPSGVNGIVFRYKDNFSFYAFVINTENKTKEIIKVVRGKEKVLYSVKDGGIVINNWLKVKIHCMANNIRVEYQDVETQGVKGVIQVEDGSFSKGQVGFFASNEVGFYIDSIQFKTYPCWKPWATRENLKVITPTSSVYIEDYTGQLENKYLIDDPSNQANGPSEWVLNISKQYWQPSSIKQKSLVYDTSPNKYPSIIVKKDVYFANGNYECVFISKSKQGTISIIFKYNNPKGIAGEENASFYSFDMVKNVEESKFSLRKFENKRFQLLHTVTEIPESLKNTVFRLGFVNDVKIKVKVTCKERDISIFIKFDDLELTQILYYKDDSPLKSGYLGIGTNTVKLEVVSFETSPFKLVVSNAVVDNYMRSGTSKPLSPGVIEKLEIEKKMKDELSDVSKGKGILGTNFESKLSSDAKSNPKDKSQSQDLNTSNNKKGLMPATSNAQFVDDIPQTELEAKDCDEKKLIESSALLHMQVCLNNKTVDSRKKYCLENNKLMDQEQCNVSNSLF